MRLSVVADKNPMDIVQADIRRAERSHTAAMRWFAQAAKLAWRDEIASAGLGGRLANTVRSSAYPQGDVSLSPAALIWTKAPAIIASHDEGSLITSKDGFWLAIPLPAAGRGPRGKRLSPGEWEQRHGMRLRFVYRGGRRALLVADDARLTVGGQARSKGGRRRRDGILTRAQTVPVFVLVPQVKLSKRTDLVMRAEALTLELGSRAVAGFD